MIKKPSLKYLSKVCAVSILLLHSFGLSAQQSIAEIRLLPIGSVVTTTGIITTGPELGQIRYMQDSDAGIALYSESLTSTLAGDSIILTGVLSSYKGQLQVSPVMSYQLIAPGLSLPIPKVKELQDPFQDLFESMRVVVPCAGIATCEPTYDSGWYILFDHQGHESRIVFKDGQALIGQAIPKTALSPTGIWTKWNGQYQLIAQDVTESNCLIIQPGEIWYFNDELHLSWQLAEDESSWVEYGLEDFDQKAIVHVINHEVNYKPQNLIQGRIYKAKFAQIFNGDTIYSPVTYFSAISNSTPIEVFFNRQVDSSFSDGSLPSGVGVSVIEQDVIERIDLVTSSLDIAMYNTTRDGIIDAFNRAVQRGVAVRYLADDETSNSALQEGLSFPVLFRSGDGIMHNKFIIADAEIPGLAWVWTGSTNFTGNQLASDPNHAYVIKDQAIALNYRKEFDEFWGTVPNHNDGRSGEVKNNNTIHSFRLGEVLIESYFSPSDETNCHILDALRSADHHVEIGLLLLTKEDLVDEIIRLHSDGIEVRVIVEDEESSSLAISRLRQAGVKIAIHELSSIFHHKYAMIDEGYTSSDPMVITGSHNWTFSADNINDENTLIIHDQSITNIFRQEFEARWSELVSTGTISISSNPSHALHPNPASDQIEMINPSAQRCTATLIDVNGSIIGKHKLAPHETINYSIDQSIPNGMYLVHWAWPGNFAVSRFVIQR